MVAAAIAAAGLATSIGTTIANSGGPTAQSSTTNQYTPQQLAYMSYLYPQMQANAQTAGGIANDNPNYPIMPGPMVQAPTNMQLTGQNMALQNAGLQYDANGNITSSGQGPLGMSTLNQGMNLAGQASRSFADSGGQPYTPTNVTTTNFPSAVSSYMNPYIEQALQPQLQDIQHQLAGQLQTNNGNAARSGAFGGDRAAVVNAETQRNANEAMNNAIGTGYSNAYNSAGQLFGMDQSQNLQAQIQNQNMGLLGFNANANQFNTDQNRMLAAGSLLGQQGSAQQTMGSNAANSVTAAGIPNQTYGQNVLSSNYGQMINQFQQPYTNLAYANSILNAQPPSLSLGSTNTYPGPSYASQALGAASTAAGLAGKMGLFNPTPAQASSAQPQDQYMGNSSQAGLTDYGPANPDAGTLKQGGSVGDMGHRPRLISIEGEIAGDPSHPMGQFREQTPGDGRPDLSSLRIAAKMLNHVADQYSRK